MKTAILGGALLLAVPIAALAAESDLHGTWKLVSQSQRLLDTGEVRAGRGKVPNGYLSFTPDGRVMQMTANEKRPKPESVAKMTDKQRIELFNTMNAFAGTYELEGSKLTYRFDLTHNEVFDRSSSRQIKIEGRRLTIVNQPARSSIDGKMVQTTTVWEKVQSR